MRGNSAIPEQIGQKIQKFVAGPYLKLDALRGIAVDEELAISGCIAIVSSTL